MVVSRVQHFLVLRAPDLAKGRRPLDTSSQSPQFPLYPTSLASAVRIEAINELPKFINFGIYSRCGKIGI